MAADPIERWGGFVPSFQGDGVLAFFGHPTAHETDAERGIRAALDLVERVPGLGGSRRGPGPPRPPLSARVGLHTGQVVIGPDPADAATGGHGAVEGNSNAGGSSEGTGVFGLTRRTLGSVNAGFIGLP